MLIAFTLVVVAVVAFFLFSSSSSSLAAPPPFRVAEIPLNAPFATDSNPTTYTSVTMPHRRKKNLTQKLPETSNCMRLYSL